MLAEGNKGVLLHQPRVWRWLRLSEMWQTTITWPQACFLWFQIYHLRNMGLPSHCKGTNQVIPKNESLIQKLEKERTAHFLAPPPPAFLACSLFLPELDSKPVGPALQPWQFSTGKFLQGAESGPLKPKKSEFLQLQYLLTFLASSMIWGVASMWTAYLKCQSTWEWFFSVSLAPHWRV